MPRPPVCKRAKSENSPCYIRYGSLAVGYSKWRIDICVGCEWSVKRIKAEETVDAKPKD